MFMFRLRFFGTKVLVIVLVKDKQVHVPDNLFVNMQDDQDLVAL